MIDKGKSLNTKIENRITKMEIELSNIKENFQDFALCDSRLTKLEITQDIIKKDMEKVKESTKGVITFKTLVAISTSIPMIIAFAQILIKFLLQNK